MIINFDQLLIKFQHNELKINLRSVIQNNKECLKELNKKSKF